MDFKGGVQCPATHYMPYMALDTDNLAFSTKFYSYLLLVSADIDARSIMSLSRGEDYCTN